jgi:hypothetical protein
MGTLEGMTPMEYLNVAEENNAETNLKIIGREGLEPIDLSKDSDNSRAVLSTFTGLRVR